MSALPIAQLAIYAPLSLPILYLLYTHGRHGFLAWAYLLAFCVLRMTGDALAINDENNSGAQIISSIGLSPLLLSVEGVLHEGRVYWFPSLNRKPEYTFMAVFHVLVATAVAMVGVGAGGLVSDHPKDSDLTDVKVGMALLEAAWALLVLWGIWSLRDGDGVRETGSKTQGVKEGSILVRATLIALPLLEISLVYFLVAEYTQRADLDPTTGTLAVRVVLGFLPELLAAIVLVVAGVRTGGVRKPVSGVRGSSHGPGHGHGRRRRRSSAKRGRVSNSRSRVRSISRID
ncbi:hypothetical protein BJY00DRAFT_320993 [Aspergillus carlsbadensis]|nr:hypothetical protein BJY00DRAFT_320993 [Aspergillus carlsbadensis]